ncbi:FkbM family methyltransferase [Actinokineospora soli]
MISYAQNAEDVVLARLFADQAVGRYVDIGAGDPVEASVTKHFYDRGWRGINIEPIPAKADVLRRARPEDRTLAVAVGAEPGKATLHVVEEEWGWSTLDDGLSARYRDDRGWHVQDVEVEVVTLAQVLDEHPGDVDFLKIDVEGAEQAVVEGADWDRHRPRVLVVEATEPGSPEPSHGAWEPVLLAAGYRCALFDGLNRFYAQADDTTALERLAAPANVFDGYETLRTHTLDRALREATTARAAASAYVQRLEDALREGREAAAADAEHRRSLEAAIGKMEAESARTYRYTAALEKRIAELETLLAEAHRSR